MNIPLGRESPPRFPTVLGIALLTCLTCSSKAISGPPFRTDDPEPVDFLHWEFYVASAQEFDGQGTQATLPQLEINDGIRPDVQFHLLAPVAYSHSEDGSRYGYSNTELGVKYRFIQESDRSPQIGTFPLIEIPTADRRFGETDFRAFLPVWLQKSWERFTTYGGAGFWYNPGTGNKNWIFAGWQSQYDLTGRLTLGGELCYHTADREDSRADTALGIGGFFHLSDISHILFSVGHSLITQGSANGYLGFLLTI